MDDYISKPIQLKELAAILEKYLGERQPEGDSSQGSTDE
jgi:DNA-binding response OmpR family regulator